MSVFSGRKIIAASVLLVVAVACVYVKNDIPNNMLSFMQVLFGSFVAGNSVEHVTNAFIAKKDSE